MLYDHISQDRGARTSRYLRTMRDQRYFDLYHKVDKEVLEFIDEVFTYCEGAYEKGGSYVVECMGWEEVLYTFRTMKAVKWYCKTLHGREEDVRNA